MWTRNHGLCVRKEGWRESRNYAVAANLLPFLAFRIPKRSVSLADYEDAYSDFTAPAVSMCNSSRQQRGFGDDAIFQLDPGCRLSEFLAVPLISCRQI